MTLLGIAAAIAVAAVAIALVVSGGDDDGSSETTAGTQATQTQGQAGSQPDTLEETPATTEQEPPEPEVTEIRVKDGEPVGGVASIEAEKGDTVRIDVRSDAAEELHLHGYDIEKPLKPYKTTRMEFEADIEGIVELELHGSGNQLAEITVEP